MNDITKQIEKLEKDMAEVLKRIIANAEIALEARYDGSMVNGKVHYQGVIQWSRELPRMIKQHTELEKAQKGAGR